MPFEPGQSGNPAGKPKAELLFVSALRKANAQDDGKRLRRCAEKLLDLAAEGEQWAVTELANRFDGKPSQQLIHSGDSESPLTITIKRFTEGAGG